MSLSPPTEDVVAIAALKSSLDKTINVKKTAESRGLSAVEFRRMINSVCLKSGQNCSLISGFLKTLKSLKTRCFRVNRTGDRRVIRCCLMILSCLCCRCWRCRWIRLILWNR